MDFDNSSPLTVGQQAEAKSFEQGYRGAWFRCKIKDVRSQNDQVEYLLEYFDFQDEELTWTEVYQELPLGHPKYYGEQKRELMVRPPFPPLYHKNLLPDFYPESDVLVVVNGTWKVGDLVDWWYTSCYWSGRIIKILGNGMVMIRLPKPPVGEGKIYKALCKDLRPSLNWSLEQGWTVPTSKEHGKHQPCARLVRSLHRAEDMDLKSDERSEGNPNSWNQSSRSNGHHPIARSDDMNLKSDDGREGNPNCSNQASRPDIEETDTERASSKTDRHNISEKIGNGYVTPIRRADKIEASIVELEELVNKIRWLKGILRFGFRWSNAMKPPWVLLENHGSHAE